MGSERPGKSGTTRSKDEGGGIGPIVSSAHLAAGASPALSEFEYGLMLAGAAFDRWIVRCMAAAGVPGLSATEVLVLHTVRHRDRPKKQADICLVLGIEDTHVVTYAVKKLEAAKLVTATKRGKEKFVRATPAGAEACDRYAQVRERLLVRPARSAGPGEAALSDLGGLLRALSGHYDQAARAATSL
jgi:predicted MarR family transcription regulator